MQVSKMSAFVILHPMHVEVVIPVHLQDYISLQQKVYVPPAQLHLRLVLQR